MQTIIPLAIILATISLASFAGSRLRRWVGYNSRRIELAGLALFLSSALTLLAGFACAALAVATEEPAILLGTATSVVAFIALGIVTLTADLG